MALAPLRTGPHSVRGDRLAFARPVLVREAGREGWITLHAADSDEGTVHVYVGSGGYIEKGPKALTHQHIGAIASHPAVARTTRHPAGHEPSGARDHPDFHEAGPKPRSARQTQGQEPAKSPGKPYARLHGAEQGTRQQQIGKALVEAQAAAKVATATAEAERAARRRQMADDQAARNRDLKSAGHQAFIGEHEYFALPSGDLVRAPRDRRLDENGHRVGARGVAPAHRAKETLRQHIADADERGERVSGPAAQRNPIADAAVAHQQARAELAAHRAAHDRAPNPWAPHLSPPVGDAKDRELAEKATRAQLAHQAAQAQAQGSQQQQQTAEPTARRDEPIVMPDGSTRTRDQYDMAHALGKDAADRQMRAAGRSTWNEEDYNVFARTMNDHLERNLTMGSAAANRARTKTKARESASPAVRFIGPAAR